jgi:hypothetical protein
VSDDRQRVKTFAIYEHPLDYPIGYIVREWYGDAEGKSEPGSAWAAATIEDARSLLPEGSVRIAGRDPKDPVIAEVWM